MDLIGKVIIITGASGGIGSATALALARRGAKLVLVSRTENDLIDVARMGGRESTLVVPADLTRREDIVNVISVTVTHFGKIDILINNAGVGLISNVQEIQKEDIESVFAVNFLGPLYCIQEVIPVMKSNSGGVIVNVSSMITAIATKGSGGYRASKCALNALSDAARIELKKSNIRVITIFPGLTATPFFSHCRGFETKPVKSDEKKLRGRKPEFVASKIVHAIIKEPRSQYMNLLSNFTGMFAQMLPSAAEWLLETKALFRAGNK
jgi:short-subunit dehydrogenase